MHAARYTSSTLDRLAEKVSRGKYDDGSSVTPSQTAGKLYVEIGEGMDNQVFRNGLMAKKSPDRDRVYIRGFIFNGEETRQESTSLDGEQTIHDENADSCPDTCPIFQHPPYGSRQVYKNGGVEPFRVRLDLADLASGANVCGFCAILHEGIYRHRSRWILDWAICRWLESHPECSYDEALQQEPWLVAYEEEINNGKAIDENDISLNIEFSKTSQTLDVQLTLAEHIFRRAASIVTLAILEFYSTIVHPSPWPAFGPRPHTTNNLHNGVVTEMVTWINECDANHSACTISTGAGVPTRLIELGVTEDSRQPHLRLLDTDPSQDYRYVALSHYWKRSYPLRTTQENLSEHHQRIPFEISSAVFRDAVELTWHLGLNYIWIDSLCIIQDDAADWERESARMGVVYGNAFVVVASHGYNFGFERTALKPLRDPWKPEDPIVFCRPKVDHANIFLPPEIDESWFKRGWCMQERLLARRILHLGGPDDEIWFECNAELKCECDRVEESRSVGDPTLKELRASLLPALIHSSYQDELWKYYIRVCEDYSARNLTFATDTMPAVSSLMGELAPYLGNYYAGLWEYQLLLALQWEAWDTRTCFRHPQYVAPSFSWASRSGAVIWYRNHSTLPTHDTHDFAEVVDISTTLAGLDPFGRVSAGYLALKGFVTRMKVKSTEMVGPDGRIELDTEGVGECYATLDSQQDVEELEVGDIVTCFDLMRDREDNGHGRFVSGLILLPLLQTGYYCRIGFSTMLLEHFYGAKNELVVIV